MELSKTVLAEVARDLDISATDYKRAVNRFDAVKQWLESGTYLSGWDPDIYLQGSFRLGTMVRPYINDREGDFDIDQVCELKNVLQGGVRSPKVLKNDIGDRLKEHGTYKNMLDREGKRCWTLLYASEENRPGFHLDVLPSIPSNTGEPHQIDITDKNKNSGVYGWNVSNSNAYYNWFKNLNVFSNEFKLEQQNKIFEANRESFSDPTDIPIQLYRSPLQRAVQIMKRHRDVYFANRFKKPISIIITTIAGHQYRSGDIVETIRAFTEYVKRRHHHVLRDGYLAKDGVLDYSCGEWVIPNPVHMHRADSEIENFADRWNQDFRFPLHFFKWVYQLDRDIDRFIVSANSSDLQLRTPERGEEISFLRNLETKLVGQKDQGQQIYTDELLDLIHLGIEEKVKWDTVKQISQYDYGTQTYQASKDVASVNFYQIALHRRRQLTQGAIDDIHSILSRNSSSCDFILCCNILLGSVSREIIENALKNSNINGHISWPIFRLVPDHLFLPELKSQ